MEEESGFLQGRSDLAGLIFAVAGEPQVVLEGEGSATGPGKG